MNPVSNQSNGSHPKGKSKDSKDVALSPPSTPYQEKNLPPLPALSEWPPPLEQPQRLIGTPTSITSFEPLPNAELSSLSLLSIGDTEDYITTSTTHYRVPLANVAVEEPTDTAVTFDFASPRANYDSASHQKDKNPLLSPLKEWPPPLEQPQRSIGTVTLITSSEPLPTLSSLHIPPIADRADYSPTPATNSRNPPSDIGVHVSADSDTTAAFDKASPRVDHDPAGRCSRENGNGNINTGDGDTDSLPFPHPDCDGGKSIDQSLLLTGPPCWSECAEEDLVTHLGPSERSRQEVMLEIVKSEERYVAELLKMRETFISPLLHPYVDTSSFVLVERDNMSQVETLVESESREHLPIASRFLASPAAGSDDSGDYNGNARTNVHASHQGGRADLESVLERDPREPLGSRSPRNSFVTIFLSRLSLRSRNRPNRTVSLGHRPSVKLSSTEKDQERDRMSTSTDPTIPEMRQKSKETLTKAGLTAYGGVSPHQLPEDLRLCLEGIEGILRDHLKLIKVLRKRYNEQYPLVRSLADVFMDNLPIFRGYAGYIVHLERALDQASDALSTRTSTKRQKNQLPKICALLHKLEADAEERGETGLAISLLKPFRRLLRYPQLFQAVLFHTDPWMFEYEGALQLVAEVEAIVRGIEDEKIQEEEREKTRDILERIRGLDKVIQFAIPKPSRVLVEERMLNHKESSDAKITRAVGRKGSFKLPSDILRSRGGVSIESRKDVWLVVFNDVVLRCQRIGMTSNPLGGAHSSKPSFLSELRDISRYATVTDGHRNSSTRPRNLYKFIKIENWTIDDANQPRGVVSMEDVARSRAQIYSHSRPQFTPEGNEDGSVHRSTDNVSVLESIAESQLSPGGGYGTRPTKSPSHSLYSGSSLANATSDGLPVSPNSLFSGSRSLSRSIATTPSHRSVMSQDGYSVRAFTRLGLREHGWGQIEPAAPFLRSGDPFANAKFDGRLVPLNPSLSRGRSRSCQAVALGEGRSVRKASPVPSKNTVN